MNRPKSAAQPGTEVRRGPPRLNGQSRFPQQLTSLLAFTPKHAKNIVKECSQFKVMEGGLFSVSSLVVAQWYETVRIEVDSSIIHHRTDPHQS